MPSSYFTWKDAYSVGHPVLDDQHRAIFGLLGKLHAALEQGESPQPVNALLDRAAEYARLHFETEERLMAEAGYPGLATHRQAHRDYVQRLQEIRQGPESDQPHQLFLFLKDWWLTHVTELDRDYAPALKKVQER